MIKKTFKDAVEYLDSPGDDVQENVKWDEVYARSNYFIGKKLIHGNKEDWLLYRRKYIDQKYPYQFLTNNCTTAGKHILQKMGYDVGRWGPFDTPNRLFERLKNGKKVTPFFSSGKYTLQKYTGELFQGYSIPHKEYNEAEEVLMLDPLYVTMSKYHYLSRLEHALQNEPWNLEKLEGQSYHDVGPPPNWRLHGFRLGEEPPLEEEEARY